MENKNRKYGAFSSVDNPEKLSETVASLVKLVGLVIGAYATMKGTHIAITNDMLQQSTDALVVVITSGMAIWNSSNFLFGLFRKLVVKS